MCDFGARSIERVIELQDRRTLLVEPQERVAENADCSG
jgi:hypothetical protein